MRIHGILALLTSNTLTFRVQSLYSGLYSAEVRVGIGIGRIRYRVEVQNYSTHIVSRSSQLIDERNMVSVSPYLLDINVKVYLQCCIRYLAKLTP